MEVPRVPRLTSRDVDEAIRTNQPMIATMMLESWPASTRWSFDFLKERYGSDVISLSDGRFQTLAEIPLGHCLDFFATVELGETYRHLGATPYIQDWLLLDQHPELYEDIEVPEWFRNWERSLMSVLRPGRPYHDTVALAGPAGATTYLHQDRFRTHAWLGQVMGRKKWTLFPPDQYPLLFRRPVAGAQAAVNIEDPDLERFPRYGEATPIDVVLHPGELIVVPAGWLHQVTSLDPSISVTGNWVNGANFTLFLRDAVAQRFERVRERRSRAPQALAEGLQRLCPAVGDGVVSTEPGRVVLNGIWEERALQVSGTRDATSWTLRNYQHGRRYTSFFVQPRTNLDELGLAADAQAAVRALQGFSSRGEFRVVVGFAAANLVLFGAPTGDMAQQAKAILDTLCRLAESFEPVSPDPAARGA
ncbi:MAG: cupin-like domain-containing protein [Vicinamibacterales bacterium]|nr:cupin-like domain-containing protein [Vicinamibacterales bacterium]HJN44695.1 cupin-like domain-containing protein [Vicinamibacterales bacterium]